MAYAEYMPEAIQYALPTAWIRYDRGAVMERLLNAKAAILALQAIPFQRRWVAELQNVHLKMEAAGTSRIEGADFIANELDEAMRAEMPEQLRTRSQRQANAAARVYRKIARLPDDWPVTVDLIRRIHRSIVLGCDDDHCEPGVLRQADHNVTFGMPMHRGVAGGKPCAEALERLTREAAASFREHDPLIRALALHYHFAAMHPFADGNGRTARALEALMLQRAGLKDALFVPMSNYYYDNKDAYLAALAQVRECGHDLTPFLNFALKGIAEEVSQVTGRLKKAVQKELFRSLMHELFVRLESTRKRVIVKRQIMLLNHLLDKDGEVEWQQLVRDVRGRYVSRKNTVAAIVRDVNRLQELGAVTVRREEPSHDIYIGVNLDWPSTITDTEFFERLERLPKSKTYGFLVPSSRPAAAAAAKTEPR